MPNPSFEEYSSCPTGNDLGDGQFTKCNDWWYPHTSSIGTPDYFNVCNNTIGGSNLGMVGVPTNFLGFQDAFHGNAYVGIGLFEYNLTESIIISKEMIQTKLKEKLKPCHLYKIILNISLADKASHSIKKLGVMVSTDSLQFNLLPVQNINWTNTTQLSDTSNWIKVEGQIKSNGGEQFLTIGYFSEYNSSELLFNDSIGIIGFNSYFPYYYIDSISLTEIGVEHSCAPSIPNIFSPNDDLLNDVFSIENLELNSLTIINRWGNKIITLTQNKPNWDGTYKGEECTEGTYFYIADFKKEKLTGFIQLVR